MQSIEALLLDGRFGNGESSAGLDVLRHLIEGSTNRNNFVVLPQFSRPRNAQ